MRKPPGNVLYVNLCRVCTSVYNSKKFIKMYTSIYIPHFVDSMHQLKNRRKMQNAELTGSGANHDIANKTVPKTGKHQDLISLLCYVCGTDERK